MPVRRRNSPGMPAVTEGADNRANVMGIAPAGHQVTSRQIRLSSIPNAAVINRKMPILAQAECQAMGKEVLSMAAMAEASQHCHARTARLKNRKLAIRWR